MKIEMELSEDCAWALAQLVKRIGFNDLRGLASSDVEAYDMAEAIRQLANALADAGIAPR